MLSRLFKSLVSMFEIKPECCVSVYCTPEQKAKAENIRNQIIEQYPEIDVGEIFDEPFGRHPMGGFEFYAAQGQRDDLTSFLKKIHDGLSILIHPSNVPLEPIHVTGSEASWIGPKLKMNTGCLKKEAEMYYYYYFR